jgi:sodium/bile acid cotransporter 7
MLAFLQKRWFLVALAVLIASGLVWGMQNPVAKAESPANAASQPEDAATPTGLLARLSFSQIITAVVLFLMAFSLDSDHLKAAIRSPGPVVWASLINIGGIPVLAWGLSRFQLIRDFEIGLMIAATVPCTMAAASVWTRKAKGNDAVSLMVTLATNMACFLITPFWLSVTVGQGVTLNMEAMVFDLLFVVLLPTLLGQGVRQIPPLGRFATKQKVPIGVIAQALILSLVFLAAFKAGKQLGGDGPHPSLASVLLVWGSCILVHLVAMAFGFLGGNLFGFSEANRAAVVFASSQKTLPIGVLIATAANMLGNPNLLGAGEGIPFAVFPMLMYHASQLFIDTLIADILAANATASGGR